MIASHDLSGFTPEQLASAPRIWAGRPGFQTRVFDPDWIAQRRAEIDWQKAKAAAEAAAAAKAGEAIPEFIGEFDFDAALAKYHSRSGPARRQQVLRQLLAIYPRFTRADIVGHRRSVDLVSARHHIMYEMRRRCDCSLPAIGQIMDRDHTTLIHAIRRWPEKAKRLGIPCIPLEGE
ncbi:hypothetical protein FPY71_07155 [Aureimonas fodinaquatilis]|uniref:Chromosomal replication initiator DnaA C-terminal domain-containing protein n=1 Tax=Aureimonas fodinaquatilis TaxID=2565783 RepID=A0A5B0DWQ5_9HYPH|nr:helix-turn-helix domain-containing protein [Aureimonas fodinaquatilis]KAA0970295.1 hypothetical protein FPY71_07155 [Aureimonas fodinaquatilis]